MNAAPAAVPTLPADLAALLDAHGELRLTHPTTGRPIRLVPGDAVAHDAADERPPTAEEQAELDGYQTDLEAIREGVAEADAGLCRPVEEFFAEMEAEFPELTDPTAGTAEVVAVGRFGRRDLTARDV